MLKHTGRKFTEEIVYSDWITLPDNNLTPSVAGGNCFLCATGHTAARSLTNFTGGSSGQIVILKGGNPTYKTTLVDGTYFKLNGNWTEALNSTIVLINCSGVWYELCRCAPG